MTKSPSSVADDLLESSLTADKNRRYKYDVDPSAKLVKEGGKKVHWLVLVGTEVRCCVVLQPNCRTDILGSNALMRRVEMGELSCDIA